MLDPQTQHAYATDWDAGAERTPGTVTLPALASQIAETEAILGTTNHPSDTRDYAVAPAPDYDSGLATLDTAATHAALAIQHYTRCLREFGDPALCGEWFDAASRAWHTTEDALDALAQTVPEEPPHAS